jgi:hypothetical protein
VLNWESVISLEPFDRECGGGRCRPTSIIVKNAASLAEEEATGSDADARPTNVSVTKSNPLEAYIAVGGTIKRCWFNAADPLLPKHVYRADVSPGGGTVKIRVHQRAKLRSICCRRVCREG